MQTLSIDREPVELYKLLKFASLAASGGEAKWLIGEGQVRVNDAVECRKRRKIHAGDVIALGEDTYRVTLTPS
ncbi:MAG TPA: RNA-binding protein [Gammaproteobacteria bacterium]|jgi:ribosome-associated protein|nr:RNA-binding protein [Gammaproteobacteria bacterium]